MSHVKPMFSHVCACEQCVDACRHYPGWMTIAEARAAIVAGLADKLMVDYWMGDPTIYVLCPTIVGLGASFAPFNVNNPCIFLSKDGLCEIHDSGFKPRMCRDNGCHGGAQTEKKHMKDEWDSDEGRQLISEWSNLVDMEGI